MSFALEKRLGQWREQYGDSMLAFLTILLLFRCSSAPGRRSCHLPGVRNRSRPGHDRQRADHVRQQDGIHRDAGRVLHEPCGHHFPSARALCNRPLPPGRRVVDHRDNARLGCRARGVRTGSRNVSPYYRRRSPLPSDCSRLRGTIYICRARVTSIVLRTRIAG